MNGAATPEASGGAPRVDLSVVVTTRDEEKYLPVLLGSLAAQRTDLAVEVIVVDNASTDATASMAEAAGAVVLRHTEVGDVPGMRNVGLAHARGAATLFTDADVAFSPDYLEEMARPIVVGTADVTLCLRQNVLEARFPVVPTAPSRSYVWLLRHLPAWCLTKIPIRILPWSAAWLASMVRRRRWVSPATVPDRVNTPALVVRTEVVRAAGGWQGRFGSHEDTAFCRALFAVTDRVRWRARPVLYVSGRRHFPTDVRWIPQLLLRPLLELVGLAGVRKRRAEGRHGYADPAGRR